ncbi:MAG: DinB family protein [Rhodothermaceae bacterium]|nr:DinB family protein [Rhodothermaceae bacterium]
MNYFTLISLFLLTWIMTSLRTEDDRMAFLIDHLKESEQYILDVLNDVNDTHWSHKVNDQMWSIGESAEHILVAEQAILAGIQKKISEDQPVDKEEPQSDEAVLNILYDRVNKKVKTLEPFEPTGQWASKDEFLGAFKASRATLYAFIENNEIDLQRYFNQSPAGEVSLHQMLLVLSGHTARHTHQIEEVKEALGLSTALVAFGGRVKVNVHASKREEIKRLFQDILLLEIDEQKKYDRVLFDGGGFVVFYYQENEDKLLEKAAFANSMQAGLRTTPAYFESIKRRILASGAEVYDTGSTVNPQKDFYFHAPGGQVFRLIKVEGEQGAGG